MNPAMRMILFYSQFISGNVPPINSSFRTVNDGRNRVTNGGDSRVAKTT